MPLLLLIAVTSIFTTSCSQRSKPLLSKYPKEKVIREKYQCRARASLKFTDKNESFSALARIQFTHDGQNSALRLRIVNPLGLTEAVAQIDPNTRSLSRAGKDYPLQRIPQLDTWLSGAWWSELGFIFDLVDAQAEQRSFSDSSHSAKLYETLTRRIECQNESKTQTNIGRKCQIQTEKLDASVNLTFFACEKGLS